MCRLSKRVKKRAMTSFEMDRMMSNLSPQLSYEVSVPDNVTYGGSCRAAPRGVPFVLRL